MRASLHTCLLPYLNFTLIVFSLFSALSSSASSSCQLQQRLRINSFHMAGDFVLGGLFPIHQDGDLVEVNFTSKQLDLNSKGECHECKCASWLVFG